jgi:hypothetical protein
VRIDNEYNIGDPVYLKHDVDQLERQVVRIIVNPALVLQYDLACGEEASTHYYFEISKDKKVI